MSLKFSHKICVAVIIVKLRNIPTSRFGNLTWMYVQLALLGSGLFFLIGMLTGLWKYRIMLSSPDAQTPV